MKRIRHGIFAGSAAAALLLTATGCGSDGSSGAPGAVRPERVPLRHRRRRVRERPRHRVEARRRSAAGAAAGCVAVCVALLCGGCAGTDDGKEPSTPYVSIEEIASAIGCRAEVSVEAEELRQGGCETGQDAYRMATFADDSGLRAWLAEARAYGGSYLVGNRWVVTARATEDLTALRERLGGALDGGSPHGHHP